MSQKENTKGKTKRQWTGKEVARLRTLRARHPLCKTSEIIALYNQNASEPRTEEAVKGKLKKLAADDVYLSFAMVSAYYSTAAQGTLGSEMAGLQLIDTRMAFTDSGLYVPYIFSVVIS
ncbi:hypothetical protein ACMFMF_011803 [Clarireedia jacksonii]